MKQREAPQDSGMSLVRTVWDWREKAETTPGTQMRGSRRSAAVRGVVFAFVGTALRLSGFGPDPLAIAFWLAGTLLIVGAVCAPKAVLILDRGVQKIGREASLAVTVLLLGLFFLLCFVPGRILLRLRGRDPMSRGFKEGAASYWTDREPREGIEHFERQH